MTTCHICNKQAETGVKAVNKRKEVVFICFDCTKPMEIKTALETIMKSQDAKALKWAIGYTRFALDLINANAQPNYIAGQLLYVQNNITYWRHPAATGVRAAIKQYIKEHLG